MALQQKCRDQGLSILVVCWSTQVDLFVSKVFSFQVYLRYRSHGMRLSALYPGFWLPGLGSVRQRDLAHMDPGPQLLPSMSKHVNIRSSTLVLSPEISKVLS